MLLLLPGNTPDIKNHVSGSIQRIFFFCVLFEYCIDVYLPGRTTVSDRGETQFFYCTVKCENLLVISGAGR